MKDDTADFNKCYVKDLEIGSFPYCKEHGAMICVASNDNGKVYRCIQAVSLITGKCKNDCKAGCATFTKA